MYRKVSFAVCALLCAMVLCVSACAETISFNGSVTAKQTCEVYAPIGGGVQEVLVQPGQAVKADDVLATLKTTKVYAAQGGVVTGVFGQSGDSADTVAARYGALMYIEGDVRFTLSATTDNAYNAAANKLVHVGEKVYLTSRTDSTHKGTGVITSVSGTSYSVEVSEGSFEPSESCEIYRLENRTASSRIGRGTIARVDPTAITATGSIVRYAVKDGDRVERGQLLLETLDGAFDGLYMSGAQILAGTDGVVGQMNLTQGGTVQKNSVAAVIYPAGEMRVEAEVNECDLSFVHVGDQVSIELTWNQDDEVLLPGTISMISSIATAGSSVTYTVYIDFTPDEHTRYGMSAVVYTLEAGGNDAQ